MGATAPRPRPTLSRDEAASVVAGIQELISIMPAQCAPAAVYSFLTREMGQARRATSPVKIAAGLSRDARRLRAGLDGWDGSFERLLPALGRATEALAEGIGAAADIAIANAEDPAASERWVAMADQTAGAYDALVAATSLLRPPDPASTAPAVSAVSDSIPNPAPPALA